MRLALVRTLSAAIMAVSMAAAAPPNLPLTLRGASLFKNGLALVTRQAVAPAAGEFVIDGLPAPVHGSFWVTPPAGAKLEEVVSFPSTKTTSMPAATLVDLLHANVGKAVEVRTADGWQAGTILSLPERTPALPMRPVRRPFGYEYASYAPPSGEAAGFVLLQTAQGQLAINPAEVRGIRAKQLVTLRDVVDPTVALRMKLSGAGPVTVSYLAFGLTWAPSYRLDLVDNEHAAMELKATVLNDIEDLRGASLSFITGFPNLKFAGTTDPMALGADVSAFLSSLAAGGSGSNYGGPMAQQVMGNAAAMPDEPRVTLQPTEGEQAEDLFFYPRADVTLARGERGYYPLVAATVPVQGLFTWDVDLPESAPGSRMRRESGQDEQPPQVWRVLRLRNTSAVPWTTAPAMATKGDRVLGQDVLHYTSVGAETDLRVTRAVDITAKATELETARQRRAIEFHDLVTLKGTLSLLNLKGTDVTVEVTKSLWGEVLSTTPKIEPRKMGGRLVNFNPAQELKWSVTVPAGKSVELLYTYQTYVNG